MRKIKIYATIAAVCYVIYCVKSVVDNSHAPLLHQCVAGLALIAWFAWTVYTIDEKRRDREEKENERAKRE